MTRLITSTPDDYRQTRLYKELQVKSLNNHDGLSSNVDVLISTIQPILGSVGRDAFSNYTLHDALHSRKLLHLAGYIIPEDVLSSLSSLELTVLIMSFYLHDLGMVVLDKEELMGSDDFLSYEDSHEVFSSRISALREEINHAEGAKKNQLEDILSQIHHAALTDYLRPKHANIDRYETIINKCFADEDKERLFQFNGVSFKKELLQICHSHCENPFQLTSVDNTTGKMVFDVENFIRDQTFNMQFCAAILRLVDILDFDMERTPISLFRAIGIADKQLPGFKISLREWNKQMAVYTISISDNEIMVKAHCNCPSIEHAIREMCHGIEREIRDTTSIIRSAKMEVASRYHIDIPQTIKVDIRSDGYTYKDYSIHLNDAAIRNLLMGNNLYTRNFVAVRELIQNSIDACNLRQEFEKYSYTPLVKVYITKDANGRRWLVVQDNGIGMDDKVLSEYFFKIGNSYYRSDEFKALKKEKNITHFTPISRFGIGILSVFMIGDVVKVTTANKFSVRKDIIQRTLIVDNSESLAVVQEYPSTENGTKIEVQLHQDKDNVIFLTNLFGFIKETIIRPSVPVQYTTIDEETIKLESRRFYKLNDSFVETLKANHIKSIVIDLSKNSELLSGYAFFFFFEKQDGKLSYKDPNNRINWGSYPLQSSELFEGTANGSRVTVDGIFMLLKKVGSIFNTRKHVVPFLIDVDILSRNDISFDVSRTKIFGKGEIIVKKEIMDSIKKTLMETGIYSKLDEDTIKQLSRANRIIDHGIPLDKDLLSRVESLLPKEYFKPNWTIINKLSKDLDEDPTVLRGYVYAVSQKYVNN